MDGEIQRAALTQKVQRKSINDLGHTLADFSRPTDLKCTTRPCSGQQSLISKRFLSSRKNTFIYCCRTFCPSLTKVASFITQIKYTSDSINVCFLKWGLIFVLDSRNSWTSSACIRGGNRSIWDQGLFELLSLVSVRQQDRELRKINSLFLTALLVTAHPDRSSQKPTDDFYYFTQYMQLTEHPNAH